MMSFFLFTMVSLLIYFFFKFYLSMFLYLSLLVLPFTFFVCKFRFKATFSIDLFLSFCLSFFCSCFFTHLLRNSQTWNVFYLPRRHTLIGIPTKMVLLGQAKQSFSLSVFLFSSFYFSNASLYMSVRERERERKKLAKRNDQNRSHQAALYLSSEKVISYFAATIHRPQNNEQCQNLFVFCPFLS